MPRYSTSTVRDAAGQRTLAAVFEELCRRGEAAPDLFDFLARHPQASPREQAEAALIDQFHQWKSGPGRTVEEYCRRLPALAADPHLKLELAVEEFGYVEQQGAAPDLDAFIARFPDLDPAAFRRMLGESAAAPERMVGRYCLERVIGQGSFSRVYLARDKDLHRSVAIKVPHRERMMDDPRQAEMFLHEARAVAQLDHPAIAPVFDVGRTPEGDCYVVSKFIPGLSLDQRIAAGPIPQREAAILAATVAEALHHAHEQGFIHRDIKPANILLDGRGRPFLVDFGLALREEDVAHEQGLCGTPAYMSPEQARSEGHLIDGRSDIFSLGVVLYEMLAGVRPFQGGSWREVLDKVRAASPPSLRRAAPDVSAELERICSKALARRAADRYAVAQEMADDLRHFLAHAEAAPARRKVTPKGLRSFDESDADFFLSLLPGPADRDGLPESVRFWTTRLAACEAEKTFRIGLAYGPSGCGKTSLFKAGVLPRLSPHVRVVYVDATSAPAEARLLESVRRIAGDEESNLPSLLANVRRRAALAEGEKLLLVIDQFEQWLHVHGGDAETELARALRQCDGAR
ncbi:MAG: protein kinase, partial [Planctomycetes bacterium]|nr:protein kinase [Planctomycetota bacterium]